MAHRPDYTQEMIEDLADDALNAACKLIQDRLAITRGDVAAAVFSDNHVRNHLAAYIMTEIGNPDSRPRVKYKLPTGEIVPIIFDHGDQHPITIRYQMNGVIVDAVRMDALARMVCGCPIDAHSDTVNVGMGPGTGVTCGRGWPVPK